MREKERERERRERERDEIHECRLQITKSCDSHLIHHSFLALPSSFEIVFVDFIISGKPFLLLQIIHFSLEHAQLVCDVLGLLIIVHAKRRKQFSEIFLQKYNNYYCVSDSHPSPIPHSPALEWEWVWDTPDPH